MIIRMLPSSTDVAVNAIACLLALALFQSGTSMPIG